MFLGRTQRQLNEITTECAITDGRQPASPPRAQRGDDRLRGSRDDAQRDDLSSRDVVAGLGRFPADASHSSRRRLLCCVPTSSGPDGDSSQTERNDRAREALQEVRG